MKSENSPSPSKRRSLRQLSIRKRAPKEKPTTQDVHKDDVDGDTHSDQARLKSLLENLNITFVGCIFTFKDSHFEDEPSVVKRKPSRLAALRDTISDSIEKLRDAITCEKTFNQCLFVPTVETDRVKEFIRTKYPDAKLHFEGCNFFKRSSTLAEKVTRRLRNFFGIQFELDYITATVTITNHTFRAKDINIVSQHVQARIVEEG